MLPQAAGSLAARAEHPHSASVSIHLSRNVIVQTLGMAMVGLMGLSILPWPIVLAWASAATIVLGLENHLLGVATGDRGPSQAAQVCLPILRVLATTFYALAAWVLIVRGGAGARFFACGLIGASMVHVLMRHYNSPGILAASLSPYLVLIGFVGFDLTRASLRQDQPLQALAPALTVAVFAVQFWSARAQLSDAWNELMTARRDAEDRERAAEMANRAKSQFLANMSHELRTPLNGVLGMVQSLTSDGLSTVQHERVRIIRRSSETLLSVLNDLLDLSKIEAHALDLEVAPFNLEHLVRGAAAAYLSMADKKSLNFKLDIAESVFGDYLGDGGRIRRILYSLCDNAVKFTADGSIELNVRQEADHIVFEISDTGIGIDQNDLPHLFEGFFQADSTLSRRYGGAGVGLAICRELAVLMGGSIEASSRLGEGSIFTVRLPLIRVQAEPEINKGAQAPLDQTTLRVLAAEDNAVNQLVLKTLLAPAGIVPTLVENGREAVAAWERETWDMILMDIQMPEMDGIEATRAIRLREFETGRPRTPVVAVTANAMSHQIDAYTAAGMDAVVAKPIDMTLLFNVMESALESAPDDAVKPCRTGGVQS